MYKWIQILLRSNFFIIFSPLKPTFYWFSYIITILEKNSIQKTSKEKIHHTTTTATTTAIGWFLCRVIWRSLWTRYIRLRSRGWRRRYDDDDDIRALLPDDGPDKEVPEEEEVAATRDIEVKEDEVLTDELPKKHRFMSTDAVCDNNSFDTVPEQSPETWWIDGVDNTMTICTKPQPQASLNKITQGSANS